MSQSLGQLHEETEDFFIAPCSVRYLCYLNKYLCNASLDVT
jgi:hypothetical protein